MMKLKKLLIIICSICFVVALACGVAACKDDKDDVIRVSSVSLNKSELTVAVGAEETLTAIVNPSNATDKTVEWFSDNSAIATVDENGVVKGVAVGETTITVSASRKQATCKVTVTESTAVAVSSVTLNHQALVLEVGETNTNLVPTVLPANSATVSWSSSNTDCVTVNNNGHLYGVAVGTATITATAGGKSATCAVTVVAEKVVEGIELSQEELELEVGAKGTLKATLYPLGLSADIVWSSSKSDIATVDNGTVTALAVGETVITATAGEKSASCTVTVKAKAGGTDVAVESVTLNKTTLSLNVDESEKLIATVAPSNATNQNVTWKSSDEDIATVDGSGKVSAKAKGTAIITVTTVDGNKTATCTVTVNEPIKNNSIVTYAHAGEESAAFEWDDTDASKAKVEYKLSSASSYTKIDSDLIRQKSDTTARADVLGLKGGAKYDFKITSSDNTVVVANEVDIASLDRSGYAHYNYKSGVGAYNDDGTLKSNAKVIYLTEANKNNIDGKGTSIAEYLADGSKISTPVVIRIVGTVGSATWKELKYRALVDEDDYLRATEVKGLNNKQLPTASNQLTQEYLIKEGYNELNLYPEKLGRVQCDPIDGLNSKASFSLAKDGKPDRYDSCWNDCQVKGFSNLTVEGVGEDAEIFQWGFTFNGCNSIEVRNIRFWDYTEDACSFEGSENSQTLAGFKHSNFWVHHNVFDIGMNYWDVCEEQDKNDGDGATDFKKLSYVTVAYNRYNGTHKTGLVGGDDKHYQACFTFHHNYYNGCDQRMPLGRQANMHLYNNYYSSSGMYSVSLRAGAYAYIENCVFTSGKSSTKPIVLEKDSAGMPSVKVVDCTMAGSIDNKTSGSSSDIIYKGNRSGVKNVGGANLYGPNFETTSDFANYYKVTSMLDTSEVAEKIPKLAGNMKETRIFNIVIDGSSQGGGSTGGGSTDTPTVSPDADKVTASIDSAVKAEKLSVNTGSKDTQDISNVTLASGIVLTANATSVTYRVQLFEDNYTFNYRVILGKSSNGGRYIKVTTTGAATIKVYVANASTTDTTGRSIGLYPSATATTPVTGTTATNIAGGNAKIVSIPVSAGGTYYLLATATESADLSIYAIDIAASSGGNAGAKEEQSISYTEIPADPSVSGQFADGNLFTATLTSGTTVTKNFSTATADDGSGKTFDYALLPGGGGQTVTVTANKAITLTIYYVATDKEFANKNQSKDGNLTWSINGGEAQTSTKTTSKSNLVAYSETITLEEGQVVVFSLTGNRLAVYGLFAVER